MLWREAGSGRGVRRLTGGGERVLPVSLSLCTAIGTTKNPCRRSPGACWLWRLLQQLPGCCVMLACLHSAY
jgi:hypothetical protein